MRKSVDRRTEDLECMQGRKDAGANLECFV